MWYLATQKKNYEVKIGWIDIIKHWTNSELDVARDMIMVRRRRMRMMEMIMIDNGEVIMISTRR